MANKMDCMERIDNCDMFDFTEYDLDIDTTIKEYEIINQIYECPLCNEGYYWD